MTDKAVQAGQEPVGHGGPRCGGTRRDGQPCRNPAGFKTGHPGFGTCHLHLGSTAKHTKAAARRKAESDVRRTLEAMGEPVPVRNPAGRLVEVLGIADWWMRACEANVRRMEDWTATDNFGAQHKAVMVELFTEAIDRMLRATADAARLRLEERLVAIDEATADLVLVVVERALRSAVPAEFHDRFKAAFAIEAAAREVTA